MAWNYMQSPQEARDVAQEVFVRLYQSIQSFDLGEEASCVPWLLATTRNFCIDQLRRRKARPPASDLAVEEGAPIRDARPTPEESTLAEDRRRTLYRALARLSDVSREIILLKEIQGLELREISEMLSVPVGTVKSRSSRARIELARALLALDPTFGA